MSANIKVVVRPRPLDEEKKERWAPGFAVHGRRITLGAKTFDPDATLECTASQYDMYDQCSTIIDAVKNGYNGTIMVYGQTGTGKTHTMLGGGSNDGIAFQAMNDLVEYVRASTLNGKQLSLTLAMLEVYMEKVTDMLSPDQNEITLVGGYPHNAHRVTLSSPEDAAAFVKQGLEFRKVSCTAMNDRSSRSHVILSLDLAEMNADGKCDVAHLFLVDLAGSENIKKSAVNGKAAAEAGMINKSLLALKTVILTLSNSPDGNKPSHVPYRDSKLTLMLQDSIGGTARTMLIACVSPIGRDVEETKSTLEYASKARTIRNIANTEKDKMATKLRSLEVENQRLRNKLEDKIVEKNGYFVTKQEHQRVEDLETELTEARAELTKLTKAAKEANGRKDVIAGQLSMLKQMVTEANEKLDDEKGRFLEALKTIEATERSTRTMCLQALKDVDTAWEGASSSMVNEFKAWHQSVESADYLQDYQPLIEEHCKNIVTSCNSTLEKLRELFDEVCSTVKESNSREAEALDTFKVDMNRLIAEKTEAFTREAVRRREGTQTSIDAVADVFAQRIDNAPNPTHPIGIKHIADGVRTEIIDSARPLISFPTKPESIDKAINEFNQKMNRSSTTVDGLSNINAIPPVLPTGRATNAGQPPLAPSSTATTVLAERDTVNATSHPMNKRKSLSRAPVDNREELPRHRSRRESSRQSSSMPMAK